MVNSKILIRRDTAANWISANPVLGSGEQGYETDTGKMKIGDGTSNWTALLYFAGGGSGGGATGATGPQGATGPANTEGLIDGGGPSDTFSGEPVIDFGGV